MSIIELLLESAYRDTKLLERYDELGDIFNKPRDVDFLLLAKDEKMAALVRDFINDNRYGNAVVEIADSDFRIRVTINMPVTQSVLCCVSGMMACISALYELEYDGWGAVIQKQ